MTTAVKILRYKRILLAVLVLLAPFFLLFSLTLSIDEANTRKRHVSDPLMQAIARSPTELYLDAGLLRRVLNESAGVAPFRSDGRDEDSVMYRVDVAWEMMFATKGGPSEYLAGYKNPCWQSRVPESYPFFDNHYFAYHDIWGGEKQILVDALERQANSLHKLAQRGEGHRTRCLPSFYVIGVTKSGTTDLYDKMLVHPDVLAPIIKEPMWWNRLTLGRSDDMFPFKDYLDLFDSAAQLISFSSKTLSNGSMVHEKVIGDFSPAYLWDLDGWQRIPGNRGLEEPRYILAHTIKTLQPRVKIIVVLREPTARLYSQFRMWSHRTSATRFHSLVLKGVETYMECFKRHSLRHCAYSNMLHNTLEVPYGIYIRASLYYVFLRDWLEVLSRDQVFVVQAEEYFTDRAGVLSQIFQHLGLDPLDQKLQKEINRAKISNSRQKHKSISQEQMLPETERLLKKFFVPFNERLAILLNNDKFLW